MTTTTTNTGTTMPNSPYALFRQLCAYYLDCVRYSEKRQEYLFADNLNNHFLLPSLETDWFKKDELEIKYLLNDARPARNFILASKESDEIFLGYPLNSFISREGVHCICPIMLIPVEISVIPGFSQGLQIKIDRQAISLNQAWVEFHLPAHKRKQFYQACDINEKGHKIIDLESVIQYIANDFQIQLNPNSLSYSLLHRDAQKGILNSAALFVASDTNYTKRLIEEINQIKNESDEVLDTTALAYVFRNPPKPIDGNCPGEYRIATSFTGDAMNYSQIQAVEKSLNNPVSKVTGPPGTGKSFMSVNLIANELFYGGSVLFSSKNHKAIHAIFDKSSKATLSTDIPLVEFLSSPNNEPFHPWDKRKKEVETRVDLAKAYLRDNCTIIPGDAELNFKEGLVQVALDRFRDAKTILEKQENLRCEVSLYERLLVSIDELLSAIPQNSRNNEQFLARLNTLLAEINKVPHRPFFQRLFRRITKRKESEMAPSEIIHELNALVPNIAPYFSRKGSLSKEIKRYLRLLDTRRRLSDLIESQCKANREEKSFNNYENTKNSLLKALETIQENIKTVALEKYCAGITSVETEDLITRIQSQIPQTPPLAFLPSHYKLSRYEKAIHEYQTFLKIYPAWAVTLLSLHKASPCLPGLFSLLIIDEASQCDIPPIIPALFRARRVTVVGDPSQFPPVITIRPSTHEHLLEKYELKSDTYSNIVEKKYNFRENNCFSIIPNGNSIQLTEHLRCVDAIANYFNVNFYNNTLHPCVDAFPSDNSRPRSHLKAGMDWIETQSQYGDEAEANATIKQVSELLHNGFEGSIGIITPLRRIANEIKERCAKNKLICSQLKEEHINTVNSFQGDECDVIIFVLGLNKDRKTGEHWYITGNENQYIFNVAVSRAKLLFITIGDKEEARKTNIKRITDLIPQNKPPQNPKIGPGELILKKALEEKGLKPIAQYPVLGRYLDLALLDPNIDIEVDGQAWHLDKNGLRKADDIHRDLQLESKGWKVCRFWHNDVINRTEECVQTILEKIK